MPFQAFRRYQKQLLAFLAVFAILVFVLADSLPRLLSNSGGPEFQNREVATLYNKKVREFDLGLFQLQRVRANNVLNQLYPYFGQQEFGPVDDQALIDAYILDHVGKELGLPADPETAKRWIFNTAEAWHNAQRQLSPQSLAFDERPIDETGALGISAQEQFASALQRAFQQSYGNQMTIDQFFSDVANQIRIAETLKLLAQPMVTPLDAFDAYEKNEVMVTARVAEFPVEERLQGIGKPTTAELRAFFEEHQDNIPDPANGTVGFRMPRRIQVSYIVLRQPTINALEQEIRAENPEAEVRGLTTFQGDLQTYYETNYADGEELRRYYRNLLNPLPTVPEASSRVQSPLPSDVFAEPDILNEDPVQATHQIPERVETAFIAEVVETAFVTEQVNELVENRLQERIDAIFDPIREAMFLFVDDLDGNSEIDFEAIRTGLEPEIDRDDLPNLRRFVPGFARDLPGIGHATFNLTEPLATTETLTSIWPPATLTRDFEKIQFNWQEYVRLCKLGWSEVSPAVFSNLIDLTGSVEGIEFDPTRLFGDGDFAPVFFDVDPGLFDPREFTDSKGARYLVWKTVDLPESSRSFQNMVEDRISAAWRLEEARKLAEADATSLADEVRVAVKETSEGESPVTPVAALQASLGEGVTPIVAGPQTYNARSLRIGNKLAGEATREAFFGLKSEGESIASVAPSGDRMTYYTFALESRRDQNSIVTPREINYTTMLPQLQMYQQFATFESVTGRQQEVLTFLRREAGLPEDWTPPRYD